MHQKPKLFLLKEQLKLVTGKIQDLAESYRVKGEKVGILATDETQASTKQT